MHSSVLSHIHPLAPPSVSICVPPPPICLCVCVCVCVCSIQSGVKTKDVGGTASTSEFVSAIMGRIEKQKAKQEKSSKGVSKAV